VPWSAATECLVPLQVDGAGRALYCVHAIGGTVGFFAPVARRLAGIRDVYGLQCHGISPGHEPDRTIEAMAARYVEAIITAQPAGPYEVLGYSMGGLVAFEIGRQLSARGRPVGLTGILDTAPAGVPVPEVRTAQALGLISRAIGFHPPYQGDPGGPDDEQVAAFLAEAVRRGILPAAFTAADLRPMIDVYAVNGRAGSSYRPAAPYRGQLHCLFTVGSGLLSYVDEWRRCALGGVTVDVLDADHFALMHEQHAAEVVETLCGWL
jgi:thioesterase domain-containing protein